jgi:hypothetical protein
MNLVAYGSTVLDGYLILLITARFRFLQNNQNQRVARAFGYLKKPQTTGSFDERTSQELAVKR